VTGEGTLERFDIAPKFDIVAIEEFFSFGVPFSESVVFDFAEFAVGAGDGVLRGAVIEETRDVVIDISAVNITSFFWGVATGIVAFYSVETWRHEGFFVGIICFDKFENVDANIEEVEMPWKSFKADVNTFETFVMFIFSDGAFIVAFSFVDFFVPVADVEVAYADRTAEIEIQIILVSQTESHIQQTFIFFPSS
jgi:hypothetical protein